MADLASRSVVLRFRDLVTELGGTIAEHRRLIRQNGYVWWGWWRRQSEEVPRKLFAELFRDSPSRIGIVLFDSGTLRLYDSTATSVVIAPSVVGIQSPDFRSTPDYYVRGHYPAWFRLEGDIAPRQAAALTIVASPTAPAESARVEQSAPGRVLSLEALRDERPTLWIASTE